MATTPAPNRLWPPRRGRRPSGCRTLPGSTWAFWRHGPAMRCWARWRRCCCATGRRRRTPSPITRTVRRRSCTDSRERLFLGKRARKPASCWGNLVLRPRAEPCTRQRAGIGEPVPRRRQTRAGGDPWRGRRPARPLSCPSGSSYSRSTAAATSPAPTATSTPARTAAGARARRPSRPPPCGRPPCGSPNTPAPTGCARSGSICTAVSRCSPAPDRCWPRPPRSAPRCPPAAPPHSGCRPMGRCSPGR